MRETEYFIHYKNKPYRFVGVATHSETLDEHVIYECLYPNDKAKLWIRPKKMFEESISSELGTVRRFRPASRSETLALSEEFWNKSAKKLELKEMSEAEFSQYQENSAKSYAEEKVRAGNWPAEGAYERSIREFQILLPQGHKTPGHEIYSVVDSSTQKAVGMVWFGHNKEKNSVFIYDIVILESMRSAGLGRQTMRLVENRARELGAKEVALHVFGHNTRAIGLYQSLGFEVTNINMVKPLS